MKTEGNNVGGVSSLTGNWETVPGGISAVIPFIPHLVFLKEVKNKLFSSNEARA